MRHGLVAATAREGVGTALQGAGEQFLRARFQRLQPRRPGFPGLPRGHEFGAVESEGRGVALRLGIGVGRGRPGLDADGHQTRRRLIENHAGLLGRGFFLGELRQILLGAAYGFDTLRHRGFVTALYLATVVNDVLAAALRDHVREDEYDRQQ